MNSANIKELNIYENLEDIPNNYTCIGIYIEAQIIKTKGYIYTLNTRIKVKDTAEIGTTYAIVQESDYWTEYLDRATQTITNPNAEYPDTVWSTHNNEYIKTEYDENGQKIAGTHESNYPSIGNTVLVVQAESSILAKGINPETQEEKTSYDLGNNENILAFYLK